MESGDEQHSQLLAEWAKNPFQPFAIARQRPEAFKKYIFIKYARTLIQQADTLFLSDLKESVNEAHQLYVMVKHLLGPMPEKIAPLHERKTECYASLRGRLDTLSEGVALLENEFPFSGKTTAHPKSDSRGLHSLGRTLYFCAPPDIKLLELWRLVDDRLYKIRHCMNIKGVVRQLALFDPPIDPALLVRATAAGIDFGSLMADAQAPMSAYRFNFLVQKAREMCNECRAFGSALLTALEKRDGETLATMRSTQEVAVLDLVKRVKTRQLEEASAQVDALDASRSTALQRYGYYQTLVGVTGSAVPVTGETIPLLPVPSQPSANLFGIQLIPEEGLELFLSTNASILQISGTAAQTLAAVMHAFPQFGAHIQPFGPGASVTEGGQQIGAIADSIAAGLRMTADTVNLFASLSGKMGGYFRRQAEWTLQNNLAACEIMQIDRQLTAARIRVEIAQYELNAHCKQIENARATLDFMAQKFTNQELYGWMVTDTAASYFSCYQIAVAFAKKAERAYRFERGLTESNFIQFGYWDSLRKGLLAGDRLQLALMQLDAAYTDQNTREYEISRNISTQLNAPLALIALKATGRCEISIPESFFDADYPGHYMRRLKNVTLTIPCIIGPHTSLNCRLTLLSNKTRTSSDPGDSYAEDLENGDARFVNNFIALQSIATSNGQNDGGLFEVNFRDERYLPFEGAGVVSRWRLEMPKENNSFDFDTVSDVILHIKYTARDGGDPLRHAASQALTTSDSPTEMTRMFSIRHEFPTAWYRLFDPNVAAAPSSALTIELTTDRFPYQYRGKAHSIQHIDLFLSLREGAPEADYAADKPLKFTLTPPGGTAVNSQFKSDKAILDGTPHASIDVSDQSVGLGIWMIEVKAEDLANLPASLLSEASGDKPRKLRAGALNDIVLVCQYTAR